MNPQKLAGQCAKLKCCINYEVDAYVEAQKRLPSREMTLETKDSTYYHFKTDIFKREIIYSTDRSFPSNLVTISADRAFDIIAMNKKGTKPVTLEADLKPQPPKRDAQDILGQDSVTRFDSTVKKKKKKRIGETGSAPTESNSNPKEAATKEAAPNNPEAGTPRPAGNRPNNGDRPARNNNNGNGSSNRGSENRNANRNNGNRENNRENNRGGNRENKEGRENKENREGSRENNRNRQRPPRGANDKQPNSDRQPNSDKPQQQAQPRPAKPEQKPENKSENKPETKPNA